MDPQQLQALRLAQQRAQEYDHSGSATSIHARLPDGTRLEKTPKSLIIYGPTGQSIELSPPPQWISKESTTDSIEYIEKIGHLSKLSKETDFFGNEKWQDRYFVLSGSKLSYFKSPSDREPRGTISLANCYVAIKNKGEPRRKDAFQPSNSTCFSGGVDDSFNGALTRDCIALHKPGSATPTTSSKSGPSVEGPRTYYFSSDNPDDMREWVLALDINIQACSTEKSLKIFESHISQVSGTTDGIDLFNILNRLYSQY